MARYSDEEYEDDYRYSKDAHEDDLMIIWECTDCGRKRYEVPGYNEGGKCNCGGYYVEAGESYT